ncbi:hypothetical protein ACHAWF_008291 [Thalassiosira exigua]
MANAEYTGEYFVEEANHRVCRWFWEVVSEYDQEMSVRLMQFATGMLGVPASGFRCLQGNVGDVWRFTIKGVGLEACMYPRSGWPPGVPDKGRARGEIAGGHHDGGDGIRY